MGESKAKRSEYIWRFKVCPEKRETGDPMEEMIRNFLEGLLEIGCFTHKGKRVAVDGFRLNDRTSTTAFTRKKGGS